MLMPFSWSTSMSCLFLVFANTVKPMYTANGVSRSFECLCAFAPSLYLAKQLYSKRCDSVKSDLEWDLIPTPCSMMHTNSRSDGGTPSSMHPLWNVTSEFGLWLSIFLCKIEAALAKGNSASPDFTTSAGREPTSLWKASSIFLFLDGDLLAEEHVTSNVLLPE